MGQEHEFPDELLPSNMFTLKRSPILWIGSGISKRYATGFQTWDELLRGVAERFGVDNDMYTAMRMKAMVETETPFPSEDMIAMRVASELSRTLIGKLTDGSLKADDILDEQSVDQFRHGVDPLKLMICSRMREIEFRPEMAEEIECFKSLKDSVPAVITTNYDVIIETLFNHEFKVYNDIDDYYGPIEYGIGEIHKIHGTVRVPRSIVISEADYDKFHARSNIVSSKLVSMMCESPLLIMGYSMEDRIIREIIGSMFSCFSKEKAANISRNIVCIQYFKGAKPSRGMMQIESSSGMFQIQTLILDDFLPVLRDVSRYRMTFTVGQMRMLRKMMVDVSLSPDPNNDPRLAFAGIEGIDEVDPNRTVIALTSKVYINATKSFKSFTIDDVLLDVLDGCRLPAESMVDLWFEGDRRGSNVFLPIFSYLASLDRDPEDYSTKLMEYIRKKQQQFGEFFDSYCRRFQEVTDEKAMLQLMNSDKKFRRSDLIAYALHQGIINEEQAKASLKDILVNSEKSDTNLKRAVTYIGYRRIFEKN